MTLSLSKLMLLVGRSAAATGSVARMAGFKTAEGDAALGRFEILQTACSRTMLSYCSQSGEFHFDQGSGRPSIVGMLVISL